MTVYDPAFDPILYSRCEDNIFIVKSLGFVAAETSSRGASLSTWHQRLGHTNYRYIEKISDRIDMVRKDKAESHCDKLQGERGRKLGSLRYTTG